jgi:hypothetical protein
VRHSARRFNHTAWRRWTKVMSSAIPTEPT